MNGGKRLNSGHQGTEENLAGMPPCWPQVQDRVICRLVHERVEVVESQPDERLGGQCGLSDDWFASGWGWLGG